MRLWGRGAYFVVRADPSRHQIIHHNHVATLMQHYLFIHREGMQVIVIAGIWNSGAHNSGNLSFFLCLFRVNQLASVAQNHHRHTRL